MLIYAKQRNFFLNLASILITKYAVPPRGRRPYTDAHFLFVPIRFSSQTFLFHIGFIFCVETLAQSAPQDSERAQIPFASIPWATESLLQGSNQTGAEKPPWLPRAMKIG
jgi:hypothetical protein